MKTVKILSLAVLLFSFLSLEAKEYPWEKYGFKFKVITLSNGKYQEFHDLKDVVEIGSVLYNTQTQKIVGFVEQDTIMNKVDLTPHIVSRWMSPDPLSEEYSSWSPYNYVTNNPLIFIDPDGRKGLMIIDKQSQVITIKANYYVNTSSPVDFMGYSCNDLSKMQSSINKQFNKEVEGLTVSEGDYKGFSLNFELEFIEGGTMGETDALANDDFIGNSLSKLESDQTFPIVENEDGTTNTVGGMTSKNQSILMNSKEDSKTNKTHEIMHTLGVDDAHKGGPQKGKMNYPPKKMNQNDIDAIINNEYLYKYGDE